MKTRPFLVPLKSCLNRLRTTKSYMETSLHCRHLSIGWARSATTSTKHESARGMLTQRSSTFCAGYMETNIPEPEDQTDYWFISVLFFVFVFQIVIATPGRLIDVLGNCFFFFVVFINGVMIMTLLLLFSSFFYRKSLPCTQSLFLFCSWWG